MAILKDKLRDKPRNENREPKTESGEPGTERGVRGLMLSQTVRALGGFSIRWPTDDVRMRIRIGIRIEKVVMMTSEVTAVSSVSSTLP